MLDGQFIHNVFPNSKILFLIRNGKDSLFQSGLFENETALEIMFKEWDENINIFNTHCEILGNQICLKIHYEDIIMDPEHWLKVIFAFLNLELSLGSHENQRILTKLNLIKHDDPLVASSETITEYMSKSLQDKIAETMKKLRNCV